MTDTSADLPSAEPPVDEAVERFLLANREERIGRLLDLVRIPSISTLPEHAPDMRRAAEWIEAEFRRIGVDDVAIEETVGEPVVVARVHRTPGAPTALVYCHYDVQPVDPVELWETAPFEPFVREGRMIGRGTADDKGQLVMHLAALEAVLATRESLPINLTYVFEGQEEFGSTGLTAWLPEHRDRLAADVAIISDTQFFDGNLPAITTGLRGIMYAQIDVSLSPVDLHSGGYGGTVDNPANALARIVTALKGPDGRIRIPGFYDDVVPLTDADRAAFAALPFDEEAYREDIGAPALVGEAGYTTLERRGARPTLDVNGIWGGFQGDGAKTIIPAHAHAKVSCRLVANQDPERVYEQFRAFVAEIAPPGVTVETQLIHGGHPSLTPIDHPATQAAARALRAVFGVDPLYMREGGSIPVTSSFDRTLGLPVVLLGFSQPGSNAHAPNEWFDLSNFDLGTRAVVRLFDELASLPRG